MLRPALAALALLPAAALAQEGPRFAFTLGAGIEAKPGYFGSDEVAVGPDFGFSFGYLSLGPLSFGNPDPNAADQGLSFGGSFRYIGERSSDDYEELAGLEDVDAAIELGAAIRYTAPVFDAFAEIRYGVTGHESFVADLGVDLIARPTDRLTLRAGPRVFLGSDDYAATYFGVTAAEAAASSFNAFEAEGGILSAGVELTADYRLTDLWGLEAGLRFDRLQNDAADSPITTEDDQLTASLAITRRFDVRF
jgi:outer membrane scaffolding protein for murein synthesis (MipA/OmpV family)